MSIGCRGAASAPGPQRASFYRESNSSRLRQEMKGMAIFGSTSRTSPVTPRSKSTSPNKTRSSTPKSQRNSGRSTPRHRNESLERPLDIIAAPRTMSETSNISKGPDRIASEVTSGGYIVDTRSKTLNSVKSNNATSPDTEGDRDRRRGPVADVQHSLTNARNVVPNGYGKPLVTPVNKRLTLRRESSRTRTTPEAVEKMPRLVRSNSPMRRKAENRQSPSAPSSAKRNLSSSRLPAKTSESANKLRASDSSSANSKPERPAPRSSVTSKFLKSPTPPISKSNNSPARSRANSAERKPDVPATRIKSANASYHRDNAKRLSPEPDVPTKCTNRPPSRLRPPMIYSKQSNSKTLNEIHKLDDESLKKKDNRHMSPETHKKSMPSFREALNDLKRQQNSKEIKPIAVIGKPNSANHSNKSFKPQLEDIKSSFILLSKQNNHKENDKNNVSKLKPKPLNEEERRARLNDIKKKFQSRGFFHDSKYDKIEGLNWISWK